MTDIIKCFESYKNDADRNFKPDFLGKEKVLGIALDAKLSEENISFLKEFLDYADDEVLKFIWQFYYFLFETDEDFSSNFYEIDKILPPKEADIRFPGGAKAVVFLLAVENLKKWGKDKDIDFGALIESYYDRYRYMVSLNIVSDDTFGLIRLSPFLYGYSKPFILRVGRLNFELCEFQNYCEIYEDGEGSRIFAALPNYEYNQKGLQEKGGFVPFYSKDDKYVTAHVFDEKGSLKTAPEKIDLARYEKKLAPGDRVITVHIPEGGKLDNDIVRKSISDAQEIFRKYFPPIKAVVCQTWFISPGLRGEVIKDGSNMAAFADLFDTISGSDSENFSIFEHIFKVKKQPLQNLVPQNDFQKRVLDRALRGEKLYWGFGVLKKDFK